MPAIITPVVPTLPPFELAMAVMLRNLCNAHFGAVIGTGVGIGGASCCAAVAIAPHPDYGNATVLMQNFSVVYGNSRVFTGMDPDANNITNPARFRTGYLPSLTGYEEHAEQIAVRVCDSLNLPFFANGGVQYLYVQFPPCVGCGPWLIARPENWYVFHS